MNYGRRSPPDFSRCSRQLLPTGKRAFHGEPGRQRPPAAPPVHTAGRMTWFLRSLPSGLVCPTSLTGQWPELYPRRGCWPSQGTRRVWAEANAWGWPLPGAAEGEMRTGEMPRPPVTRPHWILERFIDLKSPYSLCARPTTMQSVVLT